MNDPNSITFHVPSSSAGGVGSASEAASLSKTMFVSFFSSVFALALMRAFEPKTLIVSVAEPSP